MKLPITIEYNDDTQATFTAAVPEWVRWEKHTGNTIAQAQDKMGISDLIFLAYYAMKREAGGKPVKPLDVWTETVANVVVGEANPKATESEALAE
jgi:hypothetical protein